MGLFLSSSFNYCFQDLLYDLLLVRDMYNSFSNQSAGTRFCFCYDLFLFTVLSKLANTVVLFLVRLCLVA